MLVPRLGFDRKRMFEGDLLGINAEAPGEAEERMNLESVTVVIRNAEIASCRPTHGMPRRPRRGIEQRRADAQPAKWMREFSEKRKWVELELAAAAQIVVRTDE